MPDSGMSVTSLLTEGATAAGSLAAAAASPPTAAGATTEFFSEFFPSAAHRLRAWPALWDRLQPSWLAARCPEQQLVFQLPGIATGCEVALRNPCLLPFQLAGVAIGVAGVRRLQGQQHAFLRFSLAFFSLMNLSSILCHALALRGTVLWQAALLLDIVLTGSSSLCLLYFQLLAAPTSPAGARAARRCCWATFAGLLAAAAANVWAQLPWVPEAMYLGTTALAGAATFLRLFGPWRRQQPPPSLRLRMVALLAVALMVLCLPLDPLLCAVAGPWLGTVPLLFLGSDLGFAAIVGLVAEAEAAGGCLKSD